MKPILLTLIAIARAAHQLADNTEERGPVGASEHVVDSADFKKLCEHLDELEQLPDAPGEASTGPRKAEHWLLERPDENKDTVRLNYLLANSSCMPVATGRGGFIVQKYNGHTIGRGLTERDAIDEAMLHDKSNKP